KSGEQFFVNSGDYTEVTDRIGETGEKCIGVYDLNSGCRMISALKKGFMRISALDANIPSGFVTVNSGEKRIYCDYMVFGEDSRLTGVEREFFRHLRNEV
ncbi:MAG: hypothetical protein HDT24_10770, partial [Ruminococcus sp.]|nr:hypothetical protein [Ruminococcus sp.]